MPAKQPDETGVEAGVEERSFGPGSQRKVPPRTLLPEGLNLDRAEAESKSWINVAAGLRVTRRATWKPSPSRMSRKRRRAARVPCATPCKCTSHSVDKMSGNVQWSRQMRPRAAHGHSIPTLSLVRARGTACARPRISLRAQAQYSAITSEITDLTMEKTL